MCKKNCLSCHFLCKGNATSSPKSLNKQERDKIISCDLGKINFSMFCYRGVYDPGIDYDGNDKDVYLRETIEKERKAENVRDNSCFYRKFDIGMSLVAAEELEKRETTQKEAAADRKWMFWGVMGAFATAFITMCTNISGDFFSHMLKILLFLLIF